MLGHVARTGTRVLAPALTTSGHDLLFARRLHSDFVSQRHRKTNTFCGNSLQISKMELKDSSKHCMLYAAGLSIGIGGLCANSLLLYPGCNRDLLSSSKLHGRVFSIWRRHLLCSKRSIGISILRYYNCRLSTMATT